MQCLFDLFINMCFANVQMLQMSKWTTANSKVSIIHEIKNSHYGEVLLVGVSKAFNGIGSLKVGFTKRVNVV